MSENLDLLHPRVANKIRELNLVVDVLACDPTLADTAEFCQHYKFAPEETCNAIIAAGKTDPIKYACCIILATCKLDVNKAVCKQLGIKKCSFASGEQTKSLTEMEIGGVTPVGVTDMPILIDSRVLNSKRVVLGGGNRSSKLIMDPNELKKLVGAEVIEDLAILR